MQAKDRGAATNEHVIQELQKQLHDTRAQMNGYWYVYTRLAAHHCCPEVRLPVALQTEDAVHPDKMNCGYKIMHVSHFFVVACRQESQRMQELVSRLEGGMSQLDAELNSRHQEIRLHSPVVDPSVPACVLNSSHRRGSPYDRILPPTGF